MKISTTTTRRACWRSVSYPRARPQPGARHSSRGDASSFGARRRYTAPKPEFYANLPEVGGDIHDKVGVAGQVQRV